LIKIFFLILFPLDIWWQLG